MGNKTYIGEDSQTSGNGYGDVYGDGNGYGDGDGYGYGDGSGYGDGDGSDATMLAA